MDANEGWADGESGALETEETDEELELPAGRADGNLNISAPEEAGENGDPKEFCPYPSCSESETVGENLLRSSLHRSWATAREDSSSWLGLSRALSSDATS